MDRRTQTASRTKTRSTDRVGLVADGPLIEVIVSLTAPTPASRVFLEKEEFSLDSSGTGHIEMSRGTYTLFWDVYGGDGQTYTIKLSSPVSSKWDSGPRTIKGDHDIGSHYPVKVE